MCLNDCTPLLVESFRFPVLSLLQGRPAGANPGSAPRGGAEGLPLFVPDNEIYATVEEENLTLTPLSHQIRQKKCLRSWPGEGVVT